MLGIYEQSNNSCAITVGFLNSLRLEIKDTFSFRLFQSKKLEGKIISYNILNHDWFTCTLQTKHYTQILANVHGK